MVFCNVSNKEDKKTYNMVTILILIDGFLQYEDEDFREPSEDCHNPYFNRWFSAIQRVKIHKDCMNKSQSLF